MPYDWGPHYIVPSQALETYSGNVRLRERLDEDELEKELEALGLPQQVTKVVNPWYYRKKGRGTWIKIGESAARSENFPVSWDTGALENGQYEILGLMHVIVKHGQSEIAIARESVVEVTVEN